ncbi:endonuclease/exonuclease/phosphatase family protein [Amycolatopsis sp. NPDC102389]|uniref:endonuclease/exonuclease/phosphatase family protein n=1 Tax=Amycolatopsis sp. NPDC102389 TaxID=3363941 RepID=UPI0037FB79FC
MYVSTPTTWLIKRVSLFLKIIFLISVLLVCGCTAGRALSDAAKHLLRLSVMTLNIAGALPEYSSNPEVPLPWRERYTRIGDGFKQYGVAPDIVALQEATARKEWLANGDPADHESLHFLISKLKESIGVQYRIAYLGAAPTNHPGLSQGQAVLYNSARLVNVTRAGGRPAQPGASRPSVLGVNPRMSYPCSSPAKQFKDMCKLLDGDGTYWTSVFFSDDKSNHFESGVVRFSFAEDPSSQFNLYNVHLHPLISGSIEAAASLIDYTESRKYDNTTYPPILLGDFNGGIEKFPKFDQLTGGSIDYIIGGQRASYPSAVGFSVVKTAILPGPAENPENMCAPRNVAWSDHCAVVVDLKPS